MAFAKRLKDLVREAPDRRPVSIGAASPTRLGLDERSERIARAVVGRGFQRSELLTVALPNGLEFVDAMFGCWKAGLTPQPVSHRLPRAELDAIQAIALPASWQRPGEFTTADGSSQATPQTS
jgi:bile acid-coenzyme A ligase